MRQLLIILCLSFTLHLQATEPQYERSDSVRVTQLLSEAAALPTGTNYMLHFARQLKGLPYVAKTLEKNRKERLVVNLRQLDCTTYVETVLALTLCAKNGLTRFEDYCTFLRLIRYRNGKVDYPDRLHYFTAWITDNTRMGYVYEIAAPDPPFTAMQLIDINYMTTHTRFYPMLRHHRAWTEAIRRMEQQETGKTFPYIPRQRIDNSALLRQTIHDGDIIALLTSKAGLDTSHLGIAVWHRDGLHLLNASMVHHRVVEEPMTLQQYMRHHPSQTGIRVVRVRQ